MPYKYTVFRDPEKLQEKVVEYFDKCENSTREFTLKNGDIRIRKETPSIIGLACFLDCDKSLIYDYLDINNEIYKNIDSEKKQLIFDTITRARRLIENATLQRAIDGDMSEKVAGLLLSCYGYKETAETKADITITIDGGNATDYSV